MKNFGYIFILFVLMGCDERSSEIITTYDDGTIKVEHIYTDNSKNEFKYISYYPDGKIEFEGFVVNGYYRETKKSYFPNGNPKEFCHLRDSGKFNFCCPDGDYEIFYENGKIKQSYQRRNGLENGLTVNYDTDGVKKNELNVINDTLNGVALSFYPSGELRSKMNYKNDTIKGLAIDFYKTGDTLMKYHVHNGEIAFPISKFNEDGYSVSGNYVNDSYEKVKWIWKNPKGKVIKTEILTPDNDGFIIPEINSNTVTNNGQKP